MTCDVMAWDTFLYLKISSADAAMQQKIYLYAMCIMQNFFASFVNLTAF